jgi:hypothetical protein
MSIFLTKSRRNWAVLRQTKNFKHALNSAKVAEISTNRWKRLSEDSTLSSRSASSEQDAPQNKHYKSRCSENLLALRGFGATYWPKWLTSAFAENRMASPICVMPVHVKTYTVIHGIL